MRPVGIQIDRPVTGTPKRVQRFVGKVCDAPPGAPERIRGTIIFYRSSPWKLSYSFRYEALSFDKAVIDKANKLGVRHVVQHCPDTESIYHAPIERLLASPASDMGEGWQYRLAIGEWERIPAPSGWRLPYASDTETVRWEVE